MTKNYEYIIADHIKAVLFLISDGVKPSGKQQGYVLRRLMRRLFSSSLAINIDITNREYFVDLIDSVVGIYSGTYDLAESRDFAIELLMVESGKYNKAISRGEKEWAKIFSKNTDSSEDDISNWVFDLYQTHGVPMELSFDILEKQGVNYSGSKLDELISEHQSKSQNASDKEFKSGLGETNEKTTRLHTTTHLLHRTLREMFGEEVKQKGSAITTQKARFDFSFDRRLTDEEIDQLVTNIQQKIDKSLVVSKKEMSEKEARELGAIGLFGEKYGDLVTVYSIEDESNNVYSREFCGGPHVKNTKEIGQFKFIKQKSIGSGLKRIEFDLV